VREELRVSSLVTTTLFSSSNWVQNKDRATRSRFKLCHVKHWHRHVVSLTAEQKRRVGIWLTGCWTIGSGGGLPGLPHLALVPGLHVLAVLVRDALVLGPELVHDQAQVLSGAGVHLHIHRARAQLTADRSELLRKGGLKGHRSVDKRQGSPAQMLYFYF
jgi:hypothetical protein